MLHSTLPELECHIHAMNVSRLKEVIKEARAAKAHSEKTHNKLLATAALRRINRAHKALHEALGESDV